MDLAERQQLLPSLPSGQMSRDPRRVGWLGTGQFVEKRGGDDNGRARDVLTNFRASERSQTKSYFDTLLETLPGGGKDEESVLISGRLCKSNSTPNAITG